MFMKKSIDLKKFYHTSFPTEAALLTVKDKDKTNVITVAWHCTISKKPPLFGVSVAPQRHSHKLINESKEFVINFMNYDFVEKIHFCGTNSGRNTDKISKIGLNLVNSKKISTKAIKESYACLECKLFDKIKLGDHTFFVGEIVNALIDNESFSNEILDTDKMKPCYYIGDKIYTNFNSKKEF